MNKASSSGKFINKKYNIITFGCQMNEHDSENIAGLLETEGCIEAYSKEESDISIINTCSIRENADKRFFGTLGQIKKIKEKNREHLCCVCGCMMQQEHIVDEIKAKYPWVDVIFGTHNISNLPNLLDKAYQERKKVKEILEDNLEIDGCLPSKRLYKHKALVNIMYGCNNFCTYCIVPYTRGREKSRSPEEVLAEIRDLVLDGAKEITLLGQNVNSYMGVKENGGDCDFPDLIYMINDIDGLERLRFMTSHPKDLSDKLIQAFSDCDKLCNYIHLPIQSGSTNVLKRMNRKYDRDRYLNLIKKIRDKAPGITISTDIIVGFPGETEDDFNDTVSLVNEVGFDSAFTFLYSRRRGTPADTFEDQVPEDIKHERFERLLKTLNEGIYLKNQKYEGQKVKVLVESRSKKDEGVLTGRTEGFKLVDFPGEKDLIGQIVEVKIIKAKPFSLVGELV